MQFKINIPLISLIAIPFKIKENLSITTHDELGRHTFYRNSNPIQTSNIINEHMNLNVSNLNRGVYLVRVIDGVQSITKKVVF